MPHKPRPPVSAQALDPTLEETPEPFEESTDVPPGMRRTRTTLHRGLPRWGFGLWDREEIRKVSRLGGVGRAAALTSKRLSQIGRKGAVARWGRKRQRPVKKEA